MPALSTIQHIADVVIRRTIADVGTGPELVLALQSAYPFSEDDAQQRSVWMRALWCHNVISGRISKSSEQVRTRPA
jgi:hypothetical protein